MHRILLCGLYPDGSCSILDNIGNALRCSSIQGGDQADATGPAQDMIALGAVRVNLRKWVSERHLLFRDLARAASRAARWPGSGMSLATASASTLSSQRTWREVWVMRRSEQQLKDWWVLAVATVIGSVLSVPLGWLLLWLLSLLASREGLTIDITSTNVLLMGLVVIGSLGFSSLGMTLMAMLQELEDLKVLAGETLAQEQAKTRNESSD